LSFGAIKGLPLVVSQITRRVLKRVNSAQVLDGFLGKIPFGKTCALGRAGWAGQETLRRETA
jgi:hypothetical protein